MSYNRLDYFNRNKIIYIRHPINDQPTETHSWGWYYEDGTYEYYALFNTKSMISSYKSLKWHLTVLLYLNQHWNEEQFLKIARYIVDKNNGFISFDINDSGFNDIVQAVLKSDLEYAPKNKLRKVIFKQATGLSVQDKLRITGKLIGRNKNATNSDIYEIMLYIHHQEQKITIKKIAKALKVSDRTIYRNMDEQLKKEKDLLNEELQLAKLSKIQSRS